jgi:hypothetical protein
LDEGLVRGHSSPIVPLRIDLFDPMDLFIGKDSKTEHFPPANSSDPSTRWTCFQIGVYTINNDILSDLSVCLPTWMNDRLKIL